jgi:prepilin-type N-terminal cleavage/methylation domain-containing protein
MKNNKGFNVIELLIVIAIMGILAAIAAPNLTNLVRKNRIENFTRRIYSDLMNTRVMSMDRNMTHFVRFGYIQANQYEIYADTNNSDDYTAGVDSQVLSRSGPDVVPFTFTGAVPRNELITAAFPGGFPWTSFNARGLAMRQGTICIGHTTVNVQPSVNCVVMTPTRIRLGRIELNQGCAGNCNEIQ